MILPLHPPLAPDLVLLRSDGTGSMHTLPKASPEKVAYHLRQLTKLFPRTTDQQLLQIIWAIEALRSGHAQAAARVFRFPPKAADQSPPSPYAIHPWELETLLVQLLLAPRHDPPSGTQQFDCTKFESAALLVNRLRKLEDIESALYLGRDFSIFGEMHRIAQRQFHWQRGYHNLPQIYRYAFIYAQGKCGEYFEKMYGLPIAEISFVGFSLFAHALSIPWIARTITLPELGLTTDLMNRALSLLLIPMDRARQETRKLVEQVNQRHGSPIPTAYLPSILRRYPLLCLQDTDQEFIAPIPELILMRVTSGLYYDIIPGGQALLNEANDRFEEYCASLIGAMLPRFTVRRAYQYKLRASETVHTPDLLVNDGERLVLAGECKATKLTYLAQFAEDPFDGEKKQYRQIANGVFQLWRFFSHARRELLKEVIDPNTSAVILTLDSFLTMSRELKDKIMQEAAALADEEGGITAEDRRHIVFCQIPEFEAVLSASTEETFLETLIAARLEKYVGWELSAINQNEAAGKEEVEPKKFPFSLSDLLPWWDRSKELKGQKSRNSSKLT